MKAGLNISGINSEVWRGCDVWGGEGKGGRQHSYMKAGLNISGINSKVWRGCDVWGGEGRGKWAGNVLT